MNLDKSLKNGMWHYLLGNYSQADSYLTEILHKHPRDLTTLFLEVKVCFSAGLYEDGIIHGEKILEQDLNPILEALCFIFMGCCYEGLNEPDNAQFYFNLADKCPQTRPELYYHQTILYKVMGKYKLSLEASKNALECIANGYDNLGIPELESRQIGMQHTMNNYKGIAHVLLKQYDEAIESFYTATQLAHSNSKFITDRENSWEGLGLIYYINHDYQLAIECYKTALCINPNNLCTLECLRRAYRDSDQKEKVGKIQVRIRELENTFKALEDME